MYVSESPSAQQIPSIGQTVIAVMAIVIAVIASTALLIVEIIHKRHIEILD